MHLLKEMYRDLFGFFIQDAEKEKAERVFTEARTGVNLRLVKDLFKEIQI